MEAVKLTIGYPFSPTNRAYQRFLSEISLHIISIKSAPRKLSGCRGPLCLGRGIVSTVAIDLKGEKGSARPGSSRIQGTLSKSWKNICSVSQLGDPRRVCLNWICPGRPRYLYFFEFD
ncbi:hypothetical protein CDAR_219461 [Caerostris darwini]|uniref:Uncharacterized protein n=1 Tax=Caerostris darwini TaxID=1538125 RepID=A0AAV4THP6_9ARAC|nr:hypothetical protein CDAR_219461 [Caerostris darwini]